MRGLHSGSPETLEFSLGGIVATSWAGWGCKENEYLTQHSMLSVLQ